MEYGWRGSKMYLIEFPEKKNGGHRRGEIWRCNNSEFFVSKEKHEF